MRNKEKYDFKLNYPCPLCKKDIYMSEETVHTKKGVYHYKCKHQEDVLGTREMLKGMEEHYKAHLDFKLKSQVEEFEEKINKLKRYSIKGSHGLKEDKEGVFVLYGELKTSLRKKEVNRKSTSPTFPISEVEKIGRGENE